MLEAQIDEPRLLAGLRRGDETAFVTLVREHTPAMVRLAGLYVADRAAAEEVAQETWVAVLQGLDRFEGRSSLRTWIFRILINRAKTRGERDGRTIAFSRLWDPEDDPDEPAVDPERFRPAGEKWAGGWKEFPERWDNLPEAHALSAEMRGVIGRALEGLPANQREVMRLRDVEGWSSDEVCNVLNVSETNQRVLLHRARAKVRVALELYLGRQGGGQHHDN